MANKALSSLGLLCSLGLLVQLLPEFTNNMNLGGARIATTVVTWLVTLVAVLALATDSKLGPVALHVLWGAACMAIAIEAAPSALPIRLALGLAPFLVNLAVLLPSLPVLPVALACQLLAAGALLVYAPMANISTEIERDKERLARQEAESKVYDEALKKELDALDANSPLSVFIQLNHRATDPARDQIAAAAVAKKPNLEAEVIAALEDTPNAWRVYLLIASPAIPRTPALVNAVRDSISRIAASITPSSTDGERNGHALAAVTIAEALGKAHKETIRPAMLQLRTAAGAPVKEPGYVTGREELARWFR